MNLKTKGILILTALGFGLGCGIKGPPLPPVETIEDKMYNDAAMPKAVTTTAITSKSESTDRTAVKKDTKDKK